MKHFVKIMKKIYNNIARILLVSVLWSSGVAGGIQGKQ